MSRDPKECQHERLEGDVTASAFDDHKTTRGLCPDCGQYTIATDFADGRSESREMTKDERIAWHRAVCQDVACYECGTEFGETHRDECGDTCQRAPGSDICLQCARYQDDLEYYRGEYEAGRLTPPVKFERRESSNEYVVRIGNRELTVTIDNSDYPRFLIEGATDEDGNEVTLTSNEEFELYSKLSVEVASEMTSRAEFLADLAEDR